MARIIKSAVALSFVILLLLSRSPEGPAGARGSAGSADTTVGPRKQLPSSEHVLSAFRTRKIGVHVKKGGGGGGGGGHAGGGGRAGSGGGRAGGVSHPGDGGHTGGSGYGGRVWPGGGAKPNSGTRRSSAVGSRRSPSLASAVCSSLLLGLLFASALL